MQDRSRPTPSLFRLALVPWLVVRLLLWVGALHLVLLVWMLVGGLDPWVATAAAVGLGWVGDSIVVRLHRGRTWGSPWWRAAKVLGLTAAAALFALLGVFGWEIEGLGGGAHGVPWLPATVGGLSVVVAAAVAALALLVALADPQRDRRGA